MGSVLDTIECPVCSSEASSDYYYKTGEEYIFCSHCGYKREMRFERDEDGSVCTKDGTDNRHIDNLVWVDIEVKPKACFHLKHKDSIGTAMGCLENDEDIDNFRREVANSSDSIEYAAISSYDSSSETIVLEKIIEINTI